MVTFIYLDLIGPYTCLPSTCSLIYVTRWCYIFWNVLPKWCISNTYFSINSSCTKNSPWVIGNIISLCRSCTEIWSRCFYLFTMAPLILTNNESETLGECIIWGWFYIQSCNSLTNFSEMIFCNVSLENRCINSRKILIQHETFF